MEIPQGVDSWKAPKFALVEAVASKDKQRVSLTQPYYRDGYLYATDLYCGVKVPVKNTDADTEGPVPIEALKAARKNVLPEQRAIHLNTSAEVKSGSGTVTVSRGAEDGIYFPQMDNLIPKDPQGITIGINPQLLLNVAKALGDNEVRLTIQTDDGGKPLLRAMVVKPIHRVEDNRIGVIMPVK